MAQKLRYFVRLDSALKPVIGSNITRPKRPKSGKWLEIFPENCCGIEISAIPTGVPGDFIAFTINCGDTALIDLTLSESVTTLGDVVDALNATLPFLGVFSASGTSVVLDFNSAIISAACPYNTPEMIIAVTS